MRVCSAVGVLKGLNSVFAGGELRCEVLVKAGGFLTAGHYLPIRITQLRPALFDLGASERTTWCKRR